MKKLVLSAAIILGGLSANASTFRTEAVKIEMEMLNVYTPVNSEDLPAAVILALDENYPGYLITAAYVNEYGEYKIDITIEDSEGTLYIDAAGNWLK